MSDEVLYAITATTNDGRTVWCDWWGPNPDDGWLILSFDPVWLRHGPKIRATYTAAMADPNLNNPSLTPNEEAG